MPQTHSKALTGCVLQSGSAVEQATSWPADARDRGERAQRTTHSSASLLPSLLVGFPATSSVAATDDRARGSGVGSSDMDLIVMLLVILIVLALVGSLAVSPLLWVLVIILVVFAVGGRGRYYGRRG